MAPAIATGLPDLSLPVLLLLFLLCLVSPELVVPVHGQTLDDLGFVSIDCGIKEGTSYPDSDPNRTMMRYVSDTDFVDAGAGSNADVSPPYVDPDLAVRYRNVRSFPGGTGMRSCYTLRGLTQGAKYLVRCSFYYGNYDKLNSPPAFDLYLGVNRWATVNVTAADSTYILEAVTVSPAEFLQVCLVNIGLGAPFISGHELRPVEAVMYPEATVNQTLLLLSLRPPAARFPYNRYYFWRSPKVYSVALGQPEGRRWLRACGARRLHVKEF
ncbi:probable LRR receptor-like serine/threonine-protein kinase At4g29180 isoform X1 [Brachypodium distachyon]|uniref:probable LRR receptor-like serine/threonine-protein kinase At4g29180 isoform X1 n=1 Tax=Brachypodium distachyon TaxID=15368 RepID=UPI000D0D5FD6|nr:probable LRR receptor-like serine/threonine-protein kinase At4g29180 isoform X1 [Brachypodium distachyon]|eukprot:XP_024319350.1 probable LRR receptor-like serine/threonine-protein kinase At4g29180 isoform X1 [Brachypodium distachyon]